MESDCENVRSEYLSLFVQQAPRVYASVDAHLYIIFFLFDESPQTFLVVSGEPLPLSRRTGHGRIYGSGKCVLGNERRL